MVKYYLTAALTYKNVICGMMQKNKSKSGAEILKYKSQSRLTRCGNNDKEKCQIKMNDRYIIYTKDLTFEDGMLYIPIYMTMFL